MEPNASGKVGQGCFNNMEQGFAGMPRRCTWATDREALRETSYAYASGVGGLCSS